MGELEPLRDRPAHELCILVQGVAPTAEMAEEVCMTGTRQMFYARLPDVKGSAGSVAFALDEVLRASPAYRWTINHTLRCDDPLELFPTHMTTAGDLKAMARRPRSCRSSPRRSAARTRVSTRSRSTSSSPTARRYERVKRARVLTRETVHGSTASRPSASPISSNSTRQRDQIHDLSLAAERQSGRSRHLRRAAIRAVAGYRSAR